jgi:hypothetical protein
MENNHKSVVARKKVFYASLIPNCQTANRAIFLIITPRILAQFNWQRTCDVIIKIPPKRNSLDFIECHFPTPVQFSASFVVPKREKIKTIKGRLVCAALILAN